MAGWQITAQLEPQKHSPRDDDGALAAPLAPAEAAAAARRAVAWIASMATSRLFAVWWGRGPGVRRAASEMVELRFQLQGDERGDGHDDDHDWWSDGSQ